MQFVSGDYIIEYNVINSDDSDKFDMDLLFTVGKADKVIYITTLSLSDSHLNTAATALSEFAKGFNDTCIVFSIEKTETNANAIALRYILGQAGFNPMPLSFDPNPKASLFMYWSAFTYNIAERLIDEDIAHRVDEMIRINDKSRIDLLISRLGEEHAKMLCERISAADFSAGATKGTPQKMVV